MNLSHQYSSHCYGQKILIFGPELPPIGGVSVHIARIIDRYKKSFNEVKIIDVSKELKKRSRFKYILFVIKTIIQFKPTQIDYHTSYFNSFIFELFALIIFKSFFRFKILFVDHDPRYLYKKNKLFKKFFNILCKFIDKHIIIGNSTHKSYLENNIRLKKFNIESSFLPPSEPELQAGNKIIYPQETEAFFKMHSPNIIFNAFEFTLLEGKDLYGFDRAINLISKLKKDFSNIGLLMLCSQVGNENYFKKIKTLIKEYNLQDNIHIQLDNYLLWPLFKKSDIFIRPTRSDSYGISIEEAITFNIPAIASNVCHRPLGTVLFDNNNENDLFIKTYSILKKLEKKNE